MASAPEPANGESACSTPVLSEYELARARNIERNNARLRSLGLISVAEERRSNDAAWGRPYTSGDNGGGDDGGASSSDEEYREGRKPPKKRKRPTPLPPREGERKSRRLRRLPSEGAAAEEGSEHGGEIAAARRARVRRERAAMVAECREARQRAALEVAKAGATSAARENPTATYEHCLMRVRSMTDKGLANRVRAIERAAGKHCVVKMAIFKSCLQDENMWELAEAASAALERLKALLPPPPPVD